MNTQQPLATLDVILCNQRQADGAQLKNRLTGAFM